MKSHTRARATPSFLTTLGIRELLGFQRDPLGYLMARHRAGESTPRFMAGLPFLYLHEPADVEWMLRQRSEVLVKDRTMQHLRRIVGNGLLVSEGEFWRRQRGMIAHAFTPRRIRTYGETMASIAERFARTLTHDGVVDIHDAMNRVTMEIVAKTLFDADVSDRGGDVGRALEVIMDFFANSPEVLLDLPDWVPTPRLRRFGAARETVRTIIDDIIRQRVRVGGEHGDLLDAMLAARPEDGARMSYEQLRDECLTLFLAGHETTSLLLAHTFVLLSLHPDIADRLRGEIDSVLGDRPATAEDAKALVHCDRVLSEALRLYPSAWAIGRETVVDVDLGGRTIPKGTQLIASQWAMHRDPRFFPNPEAFVPDRWTPAMRRDLPRGAYFPFADGPRVCIGNHFAMLEALLVLVAIVRRFQLELVPGERLEFAPSVTLRARRGIKMRARSVALR